MKEFEVGLRIDPEKGLLFFGLEEVNDRLLRGDKIIKLEPVGAITKQIQKSDGTVQLTISGFSIIVKLEDLTANLTQ
ncbi:MAG: hypothetical protein SAL07_24085 [Oscillatoria sp. PMC 1051.18]|nr:hypothetical protein [Oscillatoria sp. PMC 1050.18]MEC5032990.1 hypothetical protein [Oscillatoria sp. PMC 1051.18]